MIDATDRALLEDSVRAAIAGVGPDEAIDEVLVKLGWLDLLEAEPSDAIDVVFTALGNANAGATALDDVLAAALGREPRPDLAVLLPAFAAWDPPGRIEAGELRARGVATARVAAAGEMLVVCGTESEPCCVMFPPELAQRSAVRGVDAELGLHTVRVRCGAQSVARLDPDVWESALACGRRAVGHQIAGACRAMLELARSHALERVQFDRPIARFQAVQHRLAEALVAVESLEAALGAAREVPGAETAALAKALAGRTARTVAGHCQQVLAGVGFTTEHSFHRFLKRTIALEGLLGSADAIALGLGRQLLAARRVPTLIEL